MAKNSLINRIFLIIALAALGALLVYLPTTLMEQYRAAKELGAFWGTIYLVVIGIGGALLLGTSGWVAWKMFGASLRKKRRKTQLAKNPSQMSIAERESEVKQNIQDIGELRSDPSVSNEVKDELVPLIKWIQDKHEEARLEIVAFGTISSGKSSLLNALAGRDVFNTDLRGGTTVQRNEIPWPGKDSIRLVDTPGLGEIDGADHQSLATEVAKDADLVLLVVDGPLRDSEFQLLRLLGEMEKRVIVCLNKEDWYTPKDRDALLGQIARQVSDFAREQDIVSVRSRPTQRERIRVLSDGSQIEEMVEVPPDIQPLADRMSRIIKKEGQDLLMANLLLQSRGLMDEAKEKVRENLDKRAWEIIDKYTWGAAGAAALSPFPMVDLAAGVGISTKMVLDLARVYHQDIDVDMAMRLLGEQGKVLVGVAGSTLATSGFASLLKTVPGIGWVSGGLLQGCIQAVITRWIGSIFVTYFKNEMKAPPGGMAALARREWERVTSVNELRKLVTVARTQFGSGGKQDDDDDE